jgi:hypothetical protein
MGAVLGIAAFGRTQEKLGGANNGGANTPSSGFTAPSIPAPSASSFTAPAATPSSFSAPAPSFGGSFGSSAPVSLNASGKKVIPQDPDPVI